VNVNGGDMVALLAAVIWAGNSIVGRFASRAIPSVWYNALRLVVASLVMTLLLPWTIVRGDVSSVTLSTLGLLLLSVVAGYVVGDTAFIESMRLLGVARAAPIAGAHPLITSMLAVLVLGEPVTLMLVVGVVLVGCGVWLITADEAALTSGHLDRRAVMKGATLAVSAAIGWSLSTILVRPALEQIDAMVAASIYLPAAAGMMLALASCSHTADTRQRMLKRSVILGLVAGGVLTVVSSTMFLWAISLVGAARTAALLSASPIFAAGIAVLALGERLTVRLVVGMAVSSAGVLAIVIGG
jgi:DME family drug/metabolite transporter